MNDCMQGVVTALDALAGVSSAAPAAPSAPIAGTAGPLYREHIQGPGGAITDIEVGNLNNMALRRAASSPPAYYLRSPTASPAPKRPRTSQRMRFLRARELDTDAFSAANPVPEAVRTWIEGETLRKLDVGEYVSLDKNAERVRSTISIALSHDGKYFASTHGDHSVKVFEYPSRNQIACLDGHPRTPWTVCFHPSDSNLVASGCLGSECRVWHVKDKKCVRKHTFRGSISCVSFNPTGELLAVTSGKSLLLWNYAHPTPNGTISTTTPPPTPAAPQVAAVEDGNGNAANNNNNIGEPADDEAADIPLIQTTHLPVELLAGSNPFHMVDFHPSGHMLMTGEKNKNTPLPANGDEQAPEEQFTLKIIVHRFDRRMGVKFSPPVLIVPRVVAYNDAGIHFSPCGKMLAACVPVTPTSQSFHIAVLAIYPSINGKVGTVLYKSPLDKGHVTALTNLKFSSTSKHLLAGFSFRPQNPVLRTRAEQYGEMAMANGHRRNNDSSALFAPCGAPLEPRVPQVRVVDIYRVDSAFKRIRSLGADMDITENNGGAEDEINVAVFAPRDGLADGIIYGTQKGRIRMFQQASGRKGYPPGICDANCAVDTGCRNNGNTSGNNGTGCGGSGNNRLGYILQPLNTSPSIHMAANSNANNNGRWRYGRSDMGSNMQMAQIQPMQPMQPQHHIPVMPLPLPRIAHPPLPHPPINVNVGRAQSAPPAYLRETAWAGVAGGALARQSYALRQGRASAMAQPSMMITQNILPPINQGGGGGNLQYEQGQVQQAQQAHRQQEEHGRL